VELLQEWIAELEEPKVWKKEPDGTHTAVSVELPAPGYSINQVAATPTDQLRAELLLCSQKLEALASL
jgi:hypothetical protein